MPITVTAVLNHLAPQAVEGLPWYAVQTRYRFERKSAAQLQNKGIETFLPLLEESHCWSDRRKVISVPLFSGYVFVRLEPSSPRASVLRTEGVIGFVEFHGEAVPIPHKQIDDLQRLLSEKVPCLLHAFLTIGRKVRIRGGCLDGLEGILAQSGQKRLVISIACIQRSVALNIEGYELELV
ncbi:MAG TPA: UpxY family transcription antiterminator [Terriglobales bacterium]|nr:UpxY family transcription antiterminator [Terriglobales bacterium]